MKQMLSAVLVSAALLTGSFAYSGDAKPNRNATKKIPVTSTFERIVAGSNIQLVLTQDLTRPDIVIKGDEKFIPAVNISIDKGVLSITSKKNLKDKITIYVPVATLTSLELGGNASVTTEGVVKLDKVNVVVHEGGTVAMRILGNLQVEPFADCDFIYETYDRSKVVYEQEYATKAPIYAL